MYIRLDVHKRVNYYSMVDSQGTELKKNRVHALLAIEGGSPTTEGKFGKH
jgi:hypothetical protein